MTQVLDKRLVYVTGKGGVGKTTVAVALGLAAAHAGRRTLLCEVARGGRMMALFGRDRAAAAETELRERLSALSVDPHKAKQ